MIVSSRDGAWRHTPRCAALLPVPGRGDGDAHPAEELDQASRGVLGEAQGSSPLADCRPASAARGNIAVSYWRSAPSTSSPCSISASAS